MMTILLGVVLTTLATTACSDDDNTPTKKTPTPTTNEAAMITDQAKLDMIYSLVDLEGDKGRIYEMTYTVDYKLDDAINFGIDGQAKLTQFVGAYLMDTKKGKSIRFSEEDVRPMGRSATGVKAITLEENDSVVGAEKVRPGASILSISENGMGKRTPEEDYRTQTRGGKGIIAMALTEKTGDLVCMKAVGASDIEEDVMIISSEGTIIRLPVEQISEISRNTQGVRLMRTEDRVASVAIVPHVEPDGE